uniref:Uncharacterized protein n=1 Tax=Anguilla anguilla TaxID=7936 RepID=A0A0E9WD75_ANGAN
MKLMRISTLLPAKMTQFLLQLSQWEYMAIHFFLLSCLRMLFLSSIKRFIKTI